MDGIGIRSSGKPEAIKSPITFWYPAWYPERFEVKGILTRGSSVNRGLHRLSTRCCDSFK
jgi:hypothetical protein